MRLESQHHSHQRTHGEPVNPTIDEVDSNSGITMLKHPATSPLAQRRLRQQSEHFAFTPPTPAHFSGNDILFCRLGELTKWLREGNVSELERLVLIGRANFLAGAAHVEECHKSTRAFLATLPDYQLSVERLLTAICLGDEATVRALVEHKNCLQARHPATHASVLHLAVIHQHPQVLEALLEKGGAVLVNARDIEGRTASHYAAAIAGHRSRGDVIYYDLLLQNGADQNVTDEEGYTPHSYYRIPRLVNMRQVRRSSRYPPEPGDEVERMIERRDLGGLKELVLNGDYATVLQSRIFPAHRAELATTLANLNLRIQAIQESILDEDYAALKQLLDREELSQGRDQYGRTPLHLAVLYGRERFVRYLLLLFPKCIDSVDKEGRSALDYADKLPTHTKRLTMTKLLCRAGAGKASQHYNSAIFPRRLTLFGLQQEEETNGVGKAGEVANKKPSDEPLSISGAKLALEPVVAKRPSQMGGRESTSPPPSIHLSTRVRGNGSGGKSQHRTKHHGVNRAHHHSHNQHSPHRARGRAANGTQGGVRLLNPPSSVLSRLQRESIAGEEGTVAHHTLRHLHSMDDELDEGQYGRDDASISSEVENRIMGIDFSKKVYWDLEDLQFEGHADEIWSVVKKHLGNERLVKYIYAYRQAQNRLRSAFDAIEEGNIKRLKAQLDGELVQVRDTRGLTVLHLAVLKERHEMVEHIAQAFPAFLNVTDHAGRTASHYAAPQQNSIYDTLVEAGANVYLPDKDGLTAHRYRRDPDQMVLPLPVPQTRNRTRNHGRNIGEENGDNLFGSVNATEKRLQLDEHVDFDPDAPTEEQVERWLALGDVPQLEQIVLDGRSHLLIDKTAMNVASAEFLDGIGQYQTKIDAIHKAVEEGDVRRVKSLIDRIALATARDRNGMSPLHKALLYGQTNTVRYLLAKYPQCVNCADHAGRTALHYAAASDSSGEHMIKMLQKAGGDAFIEDKYGHTPFYYRTHGKRLNIRMLRDSAVMSQLVSGHLDRPLLQDLEEDISDWIHTGNVGKLEELVLNGYADLLLGRTHQVEDPEAVSFLEVLPQYQAKIQAIHKAIEQGNLRAVKLLTDRKKLSLCRDGRGLVPLHKAVVFGRTDIARYLVRNYPQSVNAMDQSKRSPLHYAAALRDGGYLYKLMRRSGADPNIFDCNGRPAKYYLRYPGEINLERMRLDTKQALKQVLHNRVAPSYLETNIQQWMREGNLGKLDQLVLSGCGDLLMDKKSNNPDTTIFLKELPNLLENVNSIHRAVREGDVITLRRLMTSKRLALARDRHGCTPLHTAIIFEQSDIIRFVAATFPSVLNAPDYNKRTAMHYAAAARDGGHYLKILGKAGADPMAVDNEGRTPDYYRRNAVFDLKLLREERDEDIELTSTGGKSANKNEHRESEPESGGQDGLVDAPRIAAADLSDSAPSPVESAMSAYSSAESDRRDELTLETEVEEDSDKSKFERLMQEKLDMPISDNGLYLARTVAPVLTKALAEVLLRRPANPIGFISDWLVRYNDEEQARQVSEL